MQEACRKTMQKVGPRDLESLPKVTKRQKDKRTWELAVVNKTSAAMGYGSHFCPSCINSWGSQPDTLPSVDTGQLTRDPPQQVESQAKFLRTWSKTTRKTVTALGRKGPVTNEHPKSKSQESQYRWWILTNVFLLLTHIRRKKDRGS